MEKRDKQMWTSRFRSDWGGVSEYNHTRLILPIVLENTILNTNKVIFHINVN